jgi:hypothetical protein
VARSSATASGVVHFIPQTLPSGRRARPISALAVRSRRRTGEADVCGEALRRLALERGQDRRVGVRGEGDRGVVVTALAHAGSVIADGSGWTVAARVQQRRGRMPAWPPSPTGALSMRRSPRSSPTVLASPAEFDRAYQAGEAELVPDDKVRRGLEARGLRLSHDPPAPPPPEPGSRRRGAVRRPRSP